MSNIATLRGDAVLAVYIDLKGKKSIVSVKAKPEFQAVLGLVTPISYAGRALAAR